MKVQKRPYKYKGQERLSKDYYLRWTRPTDHKQTWVRLVGDKRRSEEMARKGNSDGLRTAEMIPIDEKRAGIDYETDEGIADFHALGAFFVTELLAKGTPEHHVRKLARHRGHELTVNVYSKVTAENLRDDLRNLRRSRSCPIPSQRRPRKTLLRSRSVDLQVCFWSVHNVEYRCMTLEMNTARLKSRPSNSLSCSTLPDNA